MEGSSYDGSPVVRLPSEMGEELMDNPHMSSMFDLCNQLVRQLDQVSNALEDERIAHLETKEKLKAAESACEELDTTCVQAHTLLEENKEFVKNAILDAVRREEVVAALKARLLTVDTNNNNNSSTHDIPTPRFTVYEEHQGVTPATPNRERRRGTDRERESAHRPPTRGRSRSQGGRGSGAGGGGGGGVKARSLSRSQQHHRPALSEQRPNQPLLCGKGKKVTRTTLRDLLVTLHTQSDAV